MNEIREIVDLPSIEDKPLLHPFDVVPARRPYWVSWWLRRVASLPVAFLFGVVLWVISSNVVTPILVPLVVLTLAALAGHYFASQAWEHIPRKRQDRQRDSGQVRQLAASFIDAIALVSGLLILVAWLSTRDVAEHVAAYAIGAGVGVAVLQIAEVVTAAVRRPREWVAIASRLLAVAAVALAVLVASATLVGDRWTTESMVVALVGGGVMIAIQVTLWLIRLIPSRRTMTQGDEL